MNEQKTAPQEDALATLLRTQGEQRRAIQQSDAPAEEKVDRVWLLEHGDPYSA